MLDIRCGGRTCTLLCEILQISRCSWLTSDSLQWLLGFVQDTAAPYSLLRHRFKSKVGGRPVGINFGSTLVWSQSSADPAMSPTCRHGWIRCSFQVRGT